MYSLIAESVSYSFPALPYPIPAGQNVRNLGASSSQFRPPGLGSLMCDLSASLLEENL